MTTTLQKQAPFIAPPPGKPTDTTSGMRNRRRRAPPSAGATRPTARSGPGRTSAGRRAAGYVRVTTTV